ncbi:MAG TPA: SsrA-binding protein SmpB [Candidatus Acidoferrales bacterium]|nr:SsrA-binding protein SmpB [Candidatus Acidoferrales bacterium]
MSVGTILPEAGELPCHVPRNSVAFRDLRPVAPGDYHSGSMKSAAKKSERENNKIVAQNRAASYNYELLDKFEAGMVLVGTEVKTLREGKGALREAYAEIRAGEAWLVNCHIPEYLPGGARNHDPLRKRKLLLNRREIDKLVVETQQKGMTVVPLKIYFRDGMAKCELAVARGKKFHDRRESERRKEAKREADEAMYRFRRR